MTPEDVNTPDDARSWLIENGFGQTESGFWRHFSGFCVTDEVVEENPRTVIQTIAFELSMQG